VDNPIVFTSLKDDSYGGDTNNDGNASAPAPGDWGWVEFTNTSVDSQDILEYCAIRYGGKHISGSTTYYRGAANLVSASPTISHCTIFMTANYAIGIDTGSFPTVISNTFTANAANGIGVYGGTAVPQNSLLGYSNHHRPDTLNRRRPCELPKTCPIPRRRFSPANWNFARAVITR
jgi:hypothetical protein